MEINKAVQRLGWRFQQASKRTDLNFVINRNDIEALQIIDSYVVKKQKEQYRNHELFAKLYINYLTELTGHYGTSLTDPILRRRIHGILQQPIQQLIRKLVDSLNDSEKYTLFEQLEVDLKHPLIQSEQEAASNLSKLKEALMVPEKRKLLLGEYWLFETVADCLEKEINKAIGLYT
jgi:hypothetical protein